MSNTSEIPTYKKVTKVLTKLTIYLSLFIVSVISIYPVLWMLFGSLKGTNEFYTNIWGFPSSPLWENYILAWETGGIGTRFINSIISTLGTLAVILPFTSLAGYAFAKLKFPGNKVLFYFFMLSMMIPSGITAIPVFSVIINLGLLNTRLSLIIVLSAQAMGFGIFLMRAFFISLPSQLEEAALIDGCTPFGAFIRVILPLAVPGLATQVIFSGMGAWNDYFMSSILLRSPELETLPMGLVNFIGQYQIEYPQMFAYLSIITVPVIILYILGQRQFISGLTAGAIKG
jgi:raffinose/stachyose/melibiose transport system permease protein